MATSIALGLISSADLSPTEHLLLKHFIEHAVDPEFAASYLISRIAVDSDTNVESHLRSFKQDWRKIVSKCKKYEVCQAVSQLTSLVAINDEPPEQLDALARRRDGPYCFMSQKSAPKCPSAPPPGPIQSAYIFPPSMIGFIITDKVSPPKTSNCTGL